MSKRKGAPTDDACRTQPARAREDWRPRFLAILRQSLGIAPAADEAGVDSRTVYRHRAKDPEFDAAVKEAIRDCIDYLEKVAFVRATVGHRYDPEAKHAPPSDGLLSLLLSAHRREVYGRRQELSGPGGAPLTGGITVIEVDLGSDSDTPATTDNGD